MNNDKAYIYGRNAVLEALASGGDNIEKIFVSFKTHGAGINQIFSMSKKMKVTCVKQDSKKFNFLERKVCPAGRKSQGVIALMQLFESINTQELINQSFKHDKNPVIVALDGINDPHNLGAIARTAECVGAAGLLISERESSPITPTAIKVSAGALEHIPVAKCGGLTQALKQFKDNDFWIIGADMDSNITYYEFDFIRPVVLVIGGEGKGLRPSTRKQCDELVKIPIKGKIASLNASVSAGIVLYEIVRQKAKGF